MLVRKREYLTVGLACVLVSITLACAPNQSPDQIREKTAEATSTVTRDAKAMAEGVKEGLSRDKTFNINKATADDLQTLPGMTAHVADRIVAERPYKGTKELVSRRIVSQDEYERIKDRIIASQ